MKKLITVVITLFFTLAATVKGAESIPLSYLAVEANSGKVLYSHNAEVERPISSLAQVATALVALDWIERTKVELNRIIVVPQEAYTIQVGNPMNLRPGDRITLRDALYSTLLGADNVSAVTIANFVGRDLVFRRGGGQPISQFVHEMNLLAKSLGMKRTTFAAPHGLDSSYSASTSCAVDMALLGMYAMQNSAFCFIVRQPNRQIGIQTLTSNTPQIFNVTNTNSLLNTAGVDGIKTAKASMAGPCLLLSVTRNAYVVSNGSVPQRLIIVVLGTSQRYKIARSLITPSWKLWERWYKAGANTTNPKEFLTFPAKVTPQTASSFGSL